MVIPAPLPADLRHDQRGAPVRLPVARLGLRPAGLPRPAASQEVVGLDAGRETIESLDGRGGLELDLVTHDARKFFGLLLKKNGYVLEQLYSPLVVHTTPEHEELKAIAQGCITRHHSHHYFGASPRPSGGCSRRSSPGGSSRCSTSTGCC